MNTANIEYDVKHQQHTRTETKLSKDKSDSLSEKRKAALEVALQKINKSQGEGSAFVFGSAPREEIEVFTSGSLAVDIALGRGGFPEGRVIEIWGPESSGKTLLTLHAIAERQAMGGRAAFIDAEHAFDPDWAGKIGVNVDDLIFSQPATGEDAFDILETLVNSGAVDIIVVDSIAAMIPRKELEGDFGDATMGLHARLMSQGMRKVTGAIQKNNVTVIFINQVRSKIGVVFGSPNVTTGGNAMKYYASIRLEIARIETLKDGTEAIGSRTRVKVVKNKLAAPHKVAEFDILYTPGNEGYSREADIRDFGEKCELIKKSGAWYTLNTEVVAADGTVFEKGMQLGQGGEKTRKNLKANPPLRDALEKLVRNKFIVTKEAQVDDIPDNERIDA
jgi:recombination protein RecA